MSTTTPRRSDELREATHASWAAQWLHAQLGSTCSTMTIAGSMRRGARRVHDLEFVVVSKVIDVANPDGLFGSLPKQALWVKLDEMVADGTFKKHLYTNGVDPKTGEPKPPTHRWGDKYRGITLPIEDGPLQVEFFRTTREHYGLILAVRTGPQQMGILISRRLRERNYKMDQGKVWCCSTLQVIDTPTEADLFQLIELPHVPPAQRDELARLTA